jgi:hypothetical protein
MTWQTIGRVHPRQLTGARLQLHWAAQLVSASGATLLPMAKDFSHTTLGWDASIGLLAGRGVGSPSRRAALVFESLELSVLDGDRECSSLRLAGHGLEQGLAWLGEALCDDRFALALPVHDMPAHPVGEGAAFSDADAEARRELAAWFANATVAIRAVVAEDQSASPVRCWPHHFDLASLNTLDRGKDAEEARSIGIGFSPGDASYDQPYFYVTPWPYPPKAALPSLAAGAEWHTSGWTGAVLTAERLISTAHDAQQRRVDQALHGAMAACREALRV